MAATQNLEQRVAALEAQAVKPASSGQTADIDPAVVQAYIAGALTTYAASQQQTAQGLATASSGANQGLAGFNPTQYDSFWWCRSRFMCNPQSLSCLC